MPQVKRSPEYFATGHQETWSGITPVEYVVRTINRRNRRCGCLPLQHRLPLQNHPLVLSSKLAVLLIRQHVD